jgi:hypothetical protein
MPPLTLPGMRDLMRGVLVGSLATALAALLAFVIFSMLAKGE